MVAYVTKQIVCKIGRRLSMLIFLISFSDTLNLIEKTSFLHQCNIHNYIPWTSDSHIIWNNKDDVPHTVQKRTQNEKKCV